MLTVDMDLVRAVIVVVCVKRNGFISGLDSQNNELGKSQVDFGGDDRFVEILMQRIAGQQTLFASDRKYLKAKLARYKMVRHKTFAEMMVHRNQQRYNHDQPSSVRKTHSAK